jgi:EmrB/QacA subfamily drug resistance transporter
MVSMDDATIRFPVVETTVDTAVDAAMDAPTVRLPRVFAPVASGAPPVWLVALCCLGAFMAFLDSTIVNVAFPDIVAAFRGSGLSSLSWVLNGYNVLVAAFLLPAGRVADRSGCRRAFVTGLAVFTIASVACGLAGSPAFLVGARLVQAVGAAILVPTSLALLLALFPADRRLPAVTIWAASAAVAAGVGPPLGGVLTQEWSWRAVFLVNVPIGIAAVLGARRLREQRDRTGPTPDVLGAVLLTGSLGLAALGLVKANDWHWWSVPTIGCLVGGVVLFVLVVLRSVRHPAPVIAWELLRSRESLGGNLGSMSFAVAYFGLILNNVLFLTGQWHFSVLQAGLALTPAPVCTALVARPAARMAATLGTRPVAVVGCMFAAAGTAYLVWGAGHAPNFLGYWLPGVMTIGVGVGMVAPVLAGVALAGVRTADLGTASAANSAFRQLGAVLGTALVVSTLDSAASPLGGSRTAWWLVIGFLAATGAVASGLLDRGPHVRPLRTNSPPVPAPAPLRGRTPRPAPSPRTRPR